jgi:hypothetical protein
MTSWIKGQKRLVFISVAAVVAAIWFLLWSEIPQDHRGRQTTVSEAQLR